MRELKRASARVDTLDVAKGIAIVFVVLIHSALFHPSFVHTHLITRAVPIFFVMFGMTSTMWWSADPARRSVGLWYRTRFARLLPPFWIAFAGWWIGQSFVAEKPFGISPLMYSMFGFAPWMPTYWFVTVILVLVLIFPLLRVAIDRLGVPACVLAALGVMLASHVYLLPINDWMRSLLPHKEVIGGFYPFWIFVPQYLWPVVAGIALVRMSDRPSGLALCLSIAFVVVATLVPTWVAEGSPVTRIADAVADVPRALLLLGVAAALVWAEAPTSPLAWLGRHTWEVYLGHVATHHFVQSAGLLGVAWWKYPYTYTVVLLGSGVAFAWGMELTRRAIATKRASL